MSADRSRSDARRERRNASKIAWRLKARDINRVTHGSRNGVRANVGYRNDFSIGLSLDFMAFNIVRIFLLRLLGIFI